MSYLTETQDTIPRPRVRNYFWKDRFQKKVHFVLQSWSNPCIEETHATQFEIQTNPVYYSEEVFPKEERKWNNILAYEHFRGHAFEAELTKLVMRLVRRYEQDERETDGAVHWNSMIPKLCGKHFRSPKGENSRTQIGFNTFVKEATQRGSGVARIPETSYCTFVLFKDRLVRI